MTSQAVPLPAGFTPRIFINAFRGPAGRLLAALLALLILEPLINQAWQWSLLTACLWNAALIAGLFAASPHKKSHVAGLTLAALDFIVHPLAAVGLVPWLLHVHSFLAFTMMSYTVVWLLWHVLQSKHVGTRTLQEALCVYLLIGMLWAHLLVLIDVAFPGSFKFPEGLSRPDSDYLTRRSQMFEVMYFSFATLSTVGYGDVVPVRSVARMFSVLEAVIGQMYLAILIARLVGLHIAQSLTRTE